MRVLRLEAENFKRLTAVDITPAGDVVTITGKNGNGKSSVLDALWGALEGAAALPSDPVRHGADRAKLRVELGSNGVVKYIATRTIANKASGGYTTSVKVEGADGGVYPSPQKLLDDLIGELSFDPLLFSRLSATKEGRRQQFTMLAKFVPDVDFEAIANLNRGAYEKRTDVNKRAREARAAAGVIVVPAEIPERIDEQDLLDQIAGATKRDQEITAHANQVRALEERIAANRRQVEAREREVAELEQRVVKMRDEIAGLVDTAEKLLLEAQAIPPSPERIDTQALAAQLREAQAHNRRVSDALAAAERRASMTRLADSLDAEGKELTAGIEARNAAKEKAISEAKMPVAGLGFGDGEVLLNGVPFAQGSSAEQLRTSVAIAAAMNPTLRVIHIRDGSLLDEDSMAWLAQYAKDNDLQVWCEVVGTDDKVGVLIEDGHVRAAKAANE